MSVRLARVYVRVVKKSLTHVLRGEHPCSGFNGDISGVRMMMLLRLGRVFFGAAVLLPEETIILAVSVLSPNVPAVTRV